MDHRFRKDLIPQKARGKFTDSLFSDPNWDAENKEDGHRAIAQFCPGVGPRFTGTPSKLHGRPVEKTACLPHLNGSAGDSASYLIGTVLDGEIVAPWAANLPGGQSKHVQKIMGSAPLRAIELQRTHGWLEFRVFDCLWYKGTDIRSKPLGDRRAAFEAALDEWENQYARGISWGVTEAAKRKMWIESREGLVFKHKDHTYGNEKLWVKRKKEFAADVVIMGFEKAEPGKYEGLVGAIIFGQYAFQGSRKLVRMGTCSGFDDATRLNMTRRPSRYDHKVIEIKHYGREPSGAFRHPQFKHFRPDKYPTDCIFNLDEI